MQTQPLPKSVDARKWASAGVEIRVLEPVSAFPRFVEGLSSDRGDVTADLQFFRNEEGAACIEGRIATEVEVVCQRCLQPMPIALAPEFALRLVWTDAQAQAAPKGVEAVVLGEETLDLHALIEDELIVATPFVSYHPGAECPGAGRTSFGDEAGEQEQQEDAAKESPFAALKHLKSSD